MLNAGDKINNYTVVERIGTRVNGEPLYSVECSVCNADKELHTNLFKITEYELKKGRLCCGCSDNYQYTPDQYLLKIQRVGRPIKYKIIGDFSKSHSKTELLAECLNCNRTWETRICYALIGRTSCADCRVSKKKDKIGHKTKVHGYGINDADYPTQKTEKSPDGKRKVVKLCPYYATWSAMLERCFCNNHKAKYPTYKDVTCCEEWLTFSNFKSWMETQDWEGKQLDKDLLVYKNKIYSPETCVFVTSKVNNFLLRNTASRGLYPLGVTKASLIRGKYEPTNKYVAYCGHRYTKSGSRTSIYLGAFVTVEEAHKAWQKAKIKLANELLLSVDNPKIIVGLRRVIDKIQHDYDNNLITEDF